MQPKNNLTPNYFSYAIYSVIVTALLFILFGSNGWGPAAENEQAIGEISRWCERVSAGFFREPANTLGNLGFVVTGLYMFYKLSQDATSSRGIFMFSSSSLALLYATASTFLGPGSMAMHGTHTKFGAWLDNVSMVMYIILPWLYNSYKMSNWSVNTLMKIYFVTIIVYAFMRGMFGYEMGIGLDLFGVSIGLWVISEFLYRFWSPTMRILSGFVGFLVLMLFGTMPAEVFNDFNEYWWIIFFWLPGLLANKKPLGIRTYRWYFAGMIAYMSAFAIWLTGVPDSPSCDPDSMFQAHGYWHLLTAIATIFFFYHYRSEKLI